MFLNRWDSFIPWVRTAAHLWFACNLSSYMDAVKTKGFILSLEHLRLIWSSGLHASGPWVCFWGFCAGLGVCFLSCRGLSDHPQGLGGELSRGLFRPLTLPPSPPSLSPMQTGYPVRKKKFSSGNRKNVPCCDRLNRSGTGINRALHSREAKEQIQCCCRGIYWYLLCWRTDAFRFWPV